MLPRVKRVLYGTFESLHRHICLNLVHFVHALYVRRNKIDHIHNGTYMLL